MVFYSNDIFWLQCIKCNSIKCVSINNQECKIRQQIINVNSNEPSFYPCSVEKKIDVAVVVTLLMIHMQKFVFLMLLKT